MPFTLSHPAAILPLHKLLGRRSSISAMAIGSMAPDFAYFLPGIHGLMTHSLAGILIFCLPAGLLAYFIFHLLIKRPACLLLPEFLLSRLRGRVFGTGTLPPVSFWVLACSVMLGAATHIAWDALTHRNSAVVNHVDLLRSVVFTVDGSQVYLYKLLQHLSTALGLLVLAWWVQSWLAQPAAPAGSDLLKDTNQLEPPASLKVYIAGGIFIASALCCAAAGFLHWGFSPERWLFHVTVAGISGFVLTLLCYCTAWTAWTAAAGGGQRGY